MQVTKLIKYPIKSLPGIVVDESRVNGAGLSFDRMILLLQQNGLPITQREHPKLALLKCELEGEVFRVHETSMGSIEIPLTEDGLDSSPRNIQLWSARRTGLEMAKEYSEFFSNYLDLPVSVVKAPQEDKSYADGNPMLVIGEESMKDLNARVGEDLSVLRFRPNLTFSGGNAYDEDHWQALRVGDIEMGAIKACLRCVLTTVDPETGKKGKEPLRTLHTYRKDGNNVAFGMYFMPKGSGVLKVGDDVEILTSTNSG